MATTTTNFGWDIPQSTDLVKDGATAIAALGQDIDTALVDLKGGTTGQVLAKASGTDLDYSWVTTDDANAIQNAIVDAKGDLIAASAADTPARLAVGANGLSLVAASGETTGLKWGIPNAVGCAVVNTATTQTIATSTYTALTFNSELFDTNNFHDNSTNTSRLTATFAGKYQINHSNQWGLNAAGQRAAAIYKNGSTFAYFPSILGSAGIYVGNTISYVVDLAVNDYIEIFAYQTSGGNLVVYTGGGDGHTSFMYLGA